MMHGTRAGWRTIIADLSLILFMVTAAQVSHRGTSPPSPALPVAAEPSAIYRPDKDSPTLSRWLADQEADDRQGLTVVSRYSDGNIQRAFEAAKALADEAVQAGAVARIVVEPSQDSATFAMLAYDRNANWHAGCTSGAKAAAESGDAKEELCD